MASTGSHYLRDVLWTGRAELKATHYEVSPREREDEKRRDRYEFDVQELADEDARDKVLRGRDMGEPCAE